MGGGVRGGFSRDRRGRRRGGAGRCGIGIRRLGRGWRGFWVCGLVTAVAVGVAGQAG